MTKVKESDICQTRCFNSELVQEVGEALPGDDIIENAQILFSALADKSRLKILHALSNGQELWCKKCNYTADRDLNASKNLEKYARLVSPVRCGGSLRCSNWRTRRAKPCLDVKG